MNKNNISVIEGNAFSGLSNLEFLDMWGNQISEIHKLAFRGLRNLQTLNLHNNQISVISEGALTGLGNLQKLWLSGNLISEIPDEAFTSLVNLQKLGLGHNQITNVQEGALTSLTNLHTLLMDNNKISDIDKRAFWGLYSLKHLNLGGNQLRKFGSVLFENTPRPFTLDLHHNSSDNPLDCQEMCWLKKEVEDRTIEFSHSYPFGDQFQNVSVDSGIPLVAHTKVSGNHTFFFCMDKLSQTNHMSCGFDSKRFSIKTPFW